MSTRYRCYRGSLLCGLVAVACAASTTLAQQDKLVFVPIARARSCRPPTVNALAWMA